jgi:hypothetical protein
MLASVQSRFLEFCRTKRTAALTPGSIPNPSNQLDWKATLHQGGEDSSKTGDQAKEEVSGNRALSDRLKMT